jgi:hypothetical protein
LEVEMVALGGAAGGLRTPLIVREWPLVDGEREGEDGGDERMRVRWTSPRKTLPALDIATGLLKLKIRGRNPVKATRHSNIYYTSTDAEKAIKIRRSNIIPSPQVKHYNQKDLSSVSPSPPK